MKNEKLENNLQNMEGEIDGQRGYIVIILTSLDFRDGPILRRPVAVLLPSFDAGASFGVGVFSCFGVFSVAIGRHSAVLLLLLLLLLLLIRTSSTSFLLAKLGSPVLEPHLWGKKYI